MKKIRLKLIAILTVSLCSFFPVSSFADGVPVEESTAKESMSDSKPAKPSEEPAYNGPKLSDFDLARYQYCGDDSDCVVSLNGCCDCENGGQEVAINKKRLKGFSDNFKCGDVACGDKLSSNRCGGGVVSCIEHRCHYIAEEEGI